MYNVRTVSCHFNDLYEMGRGFASTEAAEAWTRFWEGVNGPGRGACFWRYCAPREPFSCGYLVSSAGSIYVHPMDFNTVLHGHGGPDFRLIRELRRLCREAAEACGTTCHFTMSELHAIGTLKPETLSEN